MVPPFSPPPPPAPMLQCQAALTPGGSGASADPSEIDEEFPKARLLFVSVVLTGVLPILMVLHRILRDGCPFRLKISLPNPTESFFLMW